MNPKEWKYTFPADMKPARYARLEIANNDSDLILYESNSLRPRKKKKSKDRKSRFFEVNFAFGNEMIFKSASMPLDMSQISLTGRIASPIVIRDSEIIADEVELLHYYGTESERKVLSAYYMRREKPPASINWVIARFERVFAVDTNSANFIGTKRISVSTVLIGSWRRATTDYSAGEFLLYYVSIDEDVDGNPELYALSTLIRRVQSDLPPSFNGKIGFITDTELGKIKQINFRQLPVYADFFLPEGFELIYATGDSGAEEFLPNSMIRACDRNSARVLNEFQEKNNLIRVS